MPTVVEQGGEQGRRIRFAGPVGVARRVLAGKHRHMEASRPRRLGCVYRTELPWGPSVTTRIETCQATSSRSSSVSHSWRLQLRMSIEPAKLERGQSRSSTLRIAGAKKRHRRPPRRGLALPGGWATRPRRGVRTAARPWHRMRLGSSSRVTTAKTDRQLIAVRAARDEQSPVGGAIEHPNRLVKDAKIRQIAE